MNLAPADVLLAASGLHLGFQAVVTAVVYPALGDVPADRFPAAHAAHARRITAVVDVLRRLIVADRLRFAAATAGAIGALVAAV